MKSNVSDNMPRMRVTTTILLQKEKVGAKNRYNFSSINHFFLSPQSIRDISVFASHSSNLIERYELLVSLDYFRQDCKTIFF